MAGLVNCDPLPPACEVEVACLQQQVPRLKAELKRLEAKVQSLVQANRRYVARAKRAERVLATSEELRAELRWRLEQLEK